MKQARLKIQKKMYLKIAQNERGWRYYAPRSEFRPEGQKVLPWPEGPGKASTQSSVIFGPKLIDISGKNVSTLILEKSSDLSRFRDCISPYF
jgi:hypothetical protein